MIKILLNKSNFRFICTLKLLRNRNNLWLPSFFDLIKIVSRQDNGCVFNNTLF